jgi:hypothetical protein
MNMSDQTLMHRVAMSGASSAGSPPVPPHLLNTGEAFRASPRGFEAQRKSNSDKADAKPHRKTLGFAAELL